MGEIVYSSQRKSIGLGIPIVGRNVSELLDYPGEAEGSLHLIAFVLTNQIAAYSIYSIAGIQYFAVLFPAPEMEKYIVEVHEVQAGSSEMIAKRKEFLYRKCKERWNGPGCELGAFQRNA